MSPAHVGLLVCPSLPGDPKVLLKKKACGMCCLQKKCPGIKCVVLQFSPLLRDPPKEPTVQGLGSKIEENIIRLTGK